MNRTLFSLLIVMFITSFNQTISSLGQNSLKNVKKDTKALTKEERIFGLVTIYRTAKQHFAYFEQVPELDWDQAFKEHLPLVEKEQHILKYYRILQRYAALLKDGHTQVYLPEKLKRQMDNLPVILDYVENNWVVIERWPTEEIINEDIPPGTILLGIEGTDTNEYIQNRILPYIAHGTIQGKRNRVNFLNFFFRDANVEIKLRYSDSSVKTRIIKANRKSAKWTNENRKKYLSKLRKGPDFLTEKLNGDCLYVRYRKCDLRCEKEFVSLIEGFGSSPPSVIVLDLRENGGGNTPYKAIRHLISKRIPDRIEKTRCSISSVDASIAISSKMGVTEEQLLTGLNKAKEKGKLPRGYIPGWLISEPGYIEPAEKHYEGRVIIIVDITTGSAAEDMAARLKTAGNVTIIGGLTNGSTGTPMFFDLPGGGQFRLCTINTPLSGDGVEPDIIVTRTIKGITEGKDEVLEAALKYLSTSSSRPALKVK